MKNDKKNLLYVNLTSQFVLWHFLRFNGYNYLFKLSKIIQNTARIFTK